MTGDLKALIERPRGVPFQKIQLESAAAARGKRRCLALLRIIVLAVGAVLLALALAALIVLAAAAIVVATAAAAAVEVQPLIELHHRSRPRRLGPRRRTGHTRST